MKNSRLLAVIIFSAAGFLFSPPARAYTSLDYYNAGLQLYNAQNYGQAIQYFSAAIQMNPNYAPALQGRANCYYAQGQYQQALSDYQQVQAIQPSSQLASMIQALQAKVSASTPAAAPPPVPGAATADSFSQGVALYQQRQYAQAIPFFQQATRDNPKNANAYYYLGVCQMQAGDMKDAAVALGVSNRLSPNPSVASYVDQLKARLTPDDQQWVDGQITATATVASAGTSTPAAPKTFGIRLEPGVLLLSLADFNTNAQSWSNEAKAAQSVDPSLGYNGSVPSGSPDIAFEPVLNLTPNFQIGLPVALQPVGTANDDLQDNNGVTVTDSFNITAVSIGVDLRYLFGTGDFQPYLCAGGLVAPINITYSAAASEFSTEVYTASGNFTGVAAGGQVSGGLDWHLGDTFVVSPFAGFQFASGNSFQATVNNNNAGTASSGQTAQLELIPTSEGSVIAPVSNGKLVIPVLNGTQGSFSAGSAVPPGSRPLVVDLSGPYLGLGISAFF